MSHTRLVDVDVPGLSLLLGGGVPVLARHQDAEESAVLLVRGPPGSGKTVLGTQLAGALARALVPGKMMDVAYGCVELLPVELAAQHAGLTPPELRERVVMPPFPVDAPEPHTGSECRIYADLLALEPGEEQAGIEGAIERLLELTERAGGKPRVVVIDSLSDGYNLGSKAPRILADALCKLAVARGMVFILLEEAIGGEPSNWSFAADLVMELGQPTGHDADRRAKTINITKNRFGRAEVGSHQTSIVQGGRYTIRPAPETYVSYVSRPLYRAHARPIERDWGVRNIDSDKRWPRLNNQTIAIIGTNSFEVRKMAYSVAVPLEGETDLSIEISDAKNSPADIHIYDPYVNGAQMLSFILGSQKLTSGRALARVILGDTRSLRLFSDQEGIVRSLMILSAVLHDRNVPLILFDSSGARFSPEGNELPLIADFADVRIVGWTNIQQPRVSATLGANLRIDWNGTL